jgi:hypothetical protein
MGKLEWLDWKQGAKDAVMMLLTAGVSLAAIVGLVLFMVSYPIIGAAFAVTAVFFGATWMMASYNNTLRTTFPKRGVSDKASDKPE